MLVEVAARQVRALGDDVGVVGGVGEHARVVWLVDVVLVGIKRIGQGLGEHIRATPTPALVCDDACAAASVEGDGTLELVEHIRVVLGDMA